MFFVLILLPDCAQGATGDVSIGSEDQVLIRLCERITRIMPLSISPTAETMSQTKQKSVVIVFFISISVIDIPVISVIETEKINGTGMMN